MNFSRCRSLWKHFKAKKAFNITVFPAQEVHKFQQGMANTQMLESQFPSSPITSFSLLIQKRGKVGNSRKCTSTFLQFFMIKSRNNSGKIFTAEAPPPHVKTSIIFQIGEPAEQNLRDLPFPLGRTRRVFAPTLSLPMNHTGCDKVTPSHGQLNNTYTLINPAVKFNRVFFGS